MFFQFVYDASLDEEAPPCMAKIEDSCTIDIPQRFSAIENIIMDRSLRASRLHKSRSMLCAQSLGLQRCI